MPEGDGIFEYRGDDENGRLAYEGKWMNKAAQARSALYSQTKPKNKQKQKKA